MKRDVDPISIFISQPNRFPPGLPARFWSKVKASSQEACWPWLGAKNIHGYGRLAVSMDRKFHEIKAPRLAWALHNNMPIPEGACIRHSCDNPTCCNPSHLATGTMLDNVRDCISRGRFKPAPISSGADHPGRKIGPKEKAEIRSSNLSGLELARLYGVHKATISAVRNYKGHYSE